MTTPSERVGSLLTVELLQALDALYPPRPPLLADSEREVWAKAGERRLIDNLWVHLRAAEENLITTPILTPS